MDYFLFLEDVEEKLHTVPWRPADEPSSFVADVVAVAVVAEPAAAVAVALVGLAAVVESSTVGYYATIAVVPNWTWYNWAADCDKKGLPFRGRALKGTRAVGNLPLDRACPDYLVAGSSVAYSFAVAVGSFAFRAGRLRVAVAG